MTNVKVYKFVDNGIKTFGKYFIWCSILYNGRNYEILREGRKNVEDSISRNILLFQGKKTANKINHINLNHF